MKNNNLSHTRLGFLTIYFSLFFCFGQEVQDTLDITNLIVKNDNNEILHNGFKYNGIAVDDNILYVEHLTVKNGIVIRSIRDYKESPIQEVSSRNSNCSRSNLYTIVYKNNKIYQEGCFLEEGIWKEYDDKRKLIKLIDYSKNTSYPIVSYINSDTIVLEKLKILLNNLKEELNESSNPLFNQKGYIANQALDSVLFVDEGYPKSLKIYSNKKLTESIIYEHIITDEVGRGFFYEKVNFYYENEVSKKEFRRNLNGEKSSFYIEYYRNGHTRVKGNYCNDKKHLQWTFYNKNGEISKKEYYLFGKNTTIAEYQKYLKLNTPAN